jgi:L-ascorbate metabolism protein UlaG (beta-lactamase superfamily)
MEITFLGLSCLRLRGREVEVVVDPLPPGAASRPLRLHPDIVVRTEGSGDPSLLRPVPGRPQEVSGPGEYEIRGVSIFGLAAGAATIMRVEVDDVRVCALGRLGRQLAESEIDALGHLDVLAVPVGGGDALEAQAAARLVNAVEPAIVVPVRYAVNGVDGDYGPVDTFAKEMGLAEGWTAQPKLNLTGSLPTAEETRVVVLEPRLAAGG